MPELVTLPPDYYLTNFRALVAFVVARYDDLLSAQERRFYQAFERLGEDGQKLYIRLLSRKGTLFRRTKLHYAEITDLSAAAQQLCAQELLTIDPPLPLSSYLTLFTKPELTERGGLTGLKTAKREQVERALLAAVAEHEAAGVEASPTFAEAAVIARLMTGESLYQLQGAEHFETFKLCFFGNLRQDLTDYVLRDLGLHRFESYALDDQNLPFRSREQIETHRCYYACCEHMESALDGDVEGILSLCEQLPQALPDDAVLRRRLDKCKLSLARQLERLQALEAAAALYAQCRQPPARERRARIAVKQGDIVAALALCQTMLDAPLNEEERYFAASFGHRTVRQAQCDTTVSANPMQLWPRPASHKPPLASVALEQRAESVELIAAAHLAQAGPCFYVENSLFTSVLGLLIWDIVFAAVPGAFFNPFQIAPSDFYTPDFYRLRRASLEQRLAQVDSAAFAEIVWRNYRNKQGTVNPLVHWEAMTEALLTLSLSRIPAAQWRSIFERLLADLRNHRSGLPDLILFPDAGGYELVEVKGPGDKLQQNQRRWMAFFAAHSIPHQVLQVEWRSDD